MVVTYVYIFILIPLSHSGNYTIQNLMLSYYPWDRLAVFWWLEEFP